MKIDRFALLDTDVAVIRLVAPGSVATGNSARELADRRCTLQRLRS